MPVVAGLSSRLCEYGGIWQQPNVSNCTTKQFIDIKNMVCNIQHNVNIINLYFVDRGIECN